MCSLAGGLKPDSAWNLLTSPDFARILSQLSLVPLWDPLRFLSQGNGLDSGRMTTDHGIRGSYSVPAGALSHPSRRWDRWDTPQPCPHCSELMWHPAGAPSLCLETDSSTPGGWACWSPPPLDAALCLLVNDSQLCRVPGLFRLSGKKRLWNPSSLLGGCGHLWGQSKGFQSWWRLLYVLGPILKCGRQRLRLLVGRPEESPLPFGFSGLPARPQAWDLSLNSRNDLWDRSQPKEPRASPEQRGVSFLPLPQTSETYSSGILRSYYWQLQKPRERVILDWEHLTIGGLLWGRANKEVGKSGEK